MNRVNKEIREFPTEDDERDSWPRADSTEYLDGSEAARVGMGPDGG